MLKIILFILSVISSVSVAQFKDGDKNSTTIRETITNYSPSGFFTSFFNPNKLAMKHSIDMSYSAFGGNGVAVSTYTNSMFFKFNDNLNIEVDASLVTSPYSSFGNEHQKSINGIYLTRAQLNYKMSENSNLMIQYYSMPQGTYHNSYYSPFYQKRFIEGF